MTAARRPFPLSAALRGGLKGYSFETLKNDAAAGLIVSLVALPLSMALSIAVGLPPRHGLYTAIVAGIAAALCGGSRTQVSGPTAAFVVIVAPIVQQHGLPGLVWCEIMAGAVLLLGGLARAGRFIHYVPYPVVTGFTAGIAVTIGTLALNDFFGLGIAALKGDYLEKAGTILRHMPGLHAADLGVGTIALLTMIFLPKIARKIPAPAAGIALGALAAWLLQSRGIHVDTLNDRFSYVTPDNLTRPGIPPYPPSFHWPEALPFPALLSLLPSALVVAALAALESLLSATVADSMARTRHDPDAELSGIGIANIASGLALGIPATGAIARTATNIHAGAKTPVASIVHALLILLYMVTLAPLIDKIPMAALAALLLMVAARMSHVRQFARILLLGARRDIAVLLVTFFLTVLVDMVAGVGAGMALALLLFSDQIAKTRRPLPDAPPEPRLPPGTALWRIPGPLFFGTASRELENVDFINDDIQKLIIDLSAVEDIDMTAMVGLKSLLAGLAHKGRTVILCCNERVTDNIFRKIKGIPAEHYVRAARSLGEALALP